MKITSRNILSLVISPLFIILFSINPSSINASDNGYMETFPISSPSTYIFSSAAGIPWGQTFILHDEEYIERIEFCGDNIASASLFENHDGVEVDTWGEPMITVEVVKTDEVCYSEEYPLPWPFSVFISEEIYTHVAEFNTEIVADEVYAVRIEPDMDSDFGIKLLNGANHLYSEGNMLDPNGTIYPIISQNEDVYLKIYYDYPEDTEVSQGSLFINPQQKGRVEDEENDILCEEKLCKYEIDQGKEVQLEAIPNAGYKFNHWSGTVCKKSKESTCTFVMSEKEIAVPIFKKIHPKSSK